MSRATWTVLAAVLALPLIGCGNAPATPTKEPTATPRATATVAPTALPTTAPSPTVAPTATLSAPPTAPASPSPTPLGFTPGTKDNPRIVAIATDDNLVFWPNVIVAAEGETVTFELTATGDAEHEFMVGPEADVMADAANNEIEGITKDSPQTLTFTFDGPGPFAFACHAPGHFEHGMIGYVVLVGPDVPAVGTKENPRLVEVSMDDTLKFMPMEIPATQGETIRFLLTNTGNVTHEFAVGPKDKVDADQVDGVTVLEADEIEAHVLKVLDYTFDGTGPFGFACHEPGHFEAGMFGDIVLTAP